MKLLLFFVGVLLAGTSGYCAPLVSDPVFDYRTSLELSGRTLYRWTIDINGDGAPDTLLDIMPNSQELKMRGEDSSENIKLFTAYIASGSQFIKSSYIENGQGQVGEVVTIKADETYVGAISEIDAYGVVSVERYRKTVVAVGGSVGVTIIYAYVFDGASVVKTKLAEFDSDDSNALYDKYLSTDHRSLVTVSRIEP